MKTATIVLLFAALVTISKGAEQRHQGSDTLAESLKVAAGDDRRLSVNEVDAIVGPPDRIEQSPTWKNSELRIYFLSDGRRLEVTRNGSSIYLAVIFEKNGAILIQK